MGFVTIWFAIPPPLASLRGFKSRTWTLLFGFGFLVVFGCRFIWMFLSWLCLFTGVLSEIGREVTRKVGFFYRRKRRQRRLHLAPATERQSLYRISTTNEHQFIRISVDSWLSYFGAREATISSKRGSPRRGSQNGSSFRFP